MDEMLAVSRRLRVNPDTGAVTTVANIAGDPFGVAIEADGNILVSINSPPQILRFDPVTGAVTTVAQGPPFRFLVHIAVEADGNIVATDAAADAVFRVDPVKGAITTVAQGPPFRIPFGIAVEADGDLMVSDAFPPSVYRIDAVTAAVTTFAGPPLRPRGVEVFQLLAKAVVQVDIDIKPGSDPNSINLCSGGATPVAVLGSVDLDVNDIDITTLTLGTAGIKTVGKTARILCSVKDVNGDGFDDLVCHFVTVEIAPEAGNTEATLSCELLDGTPIEGMDSVNIVKDGC